MSEDPSSRGLSVAVQAPEVAWHERLPEVEALVEGALRATIEVADRNAPDRSTLFEICVVLADDAFMRSLNHSYRDQDKPTNVLSFAAQDEAPGGAQFADASEPSVCLLGDIVLALQTIEREAREQHKTLADHTTHLVVHGGLHLLGHDHESEQEAEAMESLEIEILAGLGIADPYGAMPAEPALSEAGR